jgi:anti-anti-sigma factor
MPLLGTSFFTLSQQSSLRRDGTAAGPIVVWLRGEHDLSTDDALCATLARAIAVDSAGLVLDLSEVEFMAASTLGVIVRAREFLRQRSSSLTVRAPSSCVRRVLDACRLNDLVGPSADLAGHALGSWVGVAPAGRGDAYRQLPSRRAEHAPVRAERPIDLRPWAASVESLAESG